MWRVNQPIEGVPHWWYAPTYGNIFINQNPIHSFSSAKLAKTRAVYDANLIWKWVFGFHRDRNVFYGCFTYEEQVLSAPEARNLFETSHELHGDSASVRTHFNDAFRWWNNNGRNLPECLLKLWLPYEQEEAPLSLPWMTDIKPRCVINNHVFVTGARALLTVILRTCRCIQWFVPSRQLCRSIGIINKWEIITKGERGKCFTKTPSSCKCFNGIKAEYFIHSVGG